MVSFSITNLARPAEQAVVSYSQCVTADQHIKEVKHAIRWARFSIFRASPYREFSHNAAHLQRHAPAYNIGNLLVTLALPDALRLWRLTIPRDRLSKIVHHRRYVGFPMARVAIPQGMFTNIQLRINWPRSRPLHT
jgi:hypothetical protein